MKKWIKIKECFEGIHFWSEAPKEVFFLRSPHRHIFHVTIQIEVFHDDRELEFIMVKRRIKDFLPKKELGQMSCEMIAMDLISKIKIQYGQRHIIIEVSEDGENGAIIDTQ